MPQTKFGIVAGTPSPAAYVSFVGSSQAKVSPPFTSYSIPVASLSILADESIFVGVVQTGTPDGVGLGAIDNLGNVYTVQEGMYFQTTPVIFGQLGVALLACMDPVPGVLTSITVSWTNSYTQEYPPQGAIALRAVRFRKVGAAQVLAPAVVKSPNFTSANTILLGPGAAGGIGICVYGSRTAGTDSFNVYQPSLYLGANNTGGDADSSNALVIMGAEAPVSADGITVLGPHHDGSRAIIHTGRAYKGYNEWG